MPVFLTLPLWGQTSEAWYCRNRVSSCNITYAVQQYTQLCYGWIFIHNMFDGSTCFGPTGPSSGASVNCVLLVWYVKIVCCSVRPYVRWLFHNLLTYGRTLSHTLWINIWPQQKLCILLDYICSKWRLVTFKQRNAFPDIGEHWTERYYHIYVSKSSKDSQNTVNILFLGVQLRTICI